MDKVISGHILVVDDQENWRDALTTLLSQDGHKLKTAASFDEAVAQLTQYTFDIVILDVRLVDTDVFNIQGIQLLEKIKSNKPASAVIVLTGYPESLRDEVLDKYGADALMLKVPTGSRFEIKDFRDKVQELLRSQLKS